MKMNRIFAVLLSSMMAAPFISGVAATAESAQEDGLHVGHYEDYQALQNRTTVTTPMTSNGVPQSALTTSLPDAYDLRNEGLVTSVKDQGAYGTCWTFAAMSSLESNLVEENPDVDLSEWFLAYYTYSEKFGFPYSLDEYGEELSAFDSGGNYYMLAPMLTGWIGPVDEADFPYNDWSVLENEKTMEDLRQETPYHVTEAPVLPYWPYSEEDLTDQIESVKTAIYDGHVMCMSYFDADDCHDYDNNSYYCPDEYSYYGGYHSVSVVGWDDNYPAENFIEDPGMDGAWLIKNSWGDEWGDDGYFWISYADQTIYEFFYLETEDADKHDDLYLHDDYGYWTGISVDAWGDQSAYMANVFTAEEDTYVTAAMFCTSQADENYEITVYTDLTDESDPTSGTASAVTSGSEPYTGYHTVDLDKAVQVQAGEKFSVVVRLSGDYGYHITCESANTDVIYYSDGSVEYMESLLTAEMLEGGMQPGESFYSADGDEWSDMYDEAVIEDSYTFTEEDYGGEFPEDEIYLTGYSTEVVIGNVCVRALTKKAGSVQFSTYDGCLLIGEEITLTSQDGSDIYYSVNGGEFQPYTEAIVFTEDMTISAYCDSDPATIYTESYTVQCAKLNSLYCEQQDGWYGADLSFKEEDERVYIASFECWEDACDYLLICPTGNGTIVYEGEVLESGEIYEIPLTWSEDGTAEITLTVSGDGMLSTTYIIELDLLELMLYGDVNADGVVDASDAAHILTYAAIDGAGGDTSYADGDWLERADYNWDGLIDATDAAQILMYAASAGVAAG